MEEISVKSKQDIIFQNLYDCMGCIVSNERLMTEAKINNPDTLCYHISRLRNKISNNYSIYSIKSVGYRMDAVIS